MKQYKNDPLYKAFLAEGLIKETKRKPRKPKTTSQLKKKVWKLFSFYIRYNPSRNGFVHCVTCGKGDNYKNLQAGHWIPGRHNAVLFDERNCHPQCYRCNVGLHGNPIAYHHYMERTYGKLIMNALEKLDKKVKQFTKDELEGLYTTYQQKLKKRGVL